jgi:hypothetical protein
MQESLSNSGSENEGHPTGPAFFTVSVLKFTLLSLSTLGLYDLYWIYKNWKVISERQGIKMRPFWRAFFAYFYIFPLLKEFRSAASSQGDFGNLAAGALATAWIVMSLTWKLPDPLSLISMFAFIALIPAVKYVNNFEKQVHPETPINSKFSVWNWVGLIIGIILFPLVVIGTFLPNN